MTYLDVTITVVTGGQENARLLPGPDSCPRCHRSVVPSFACEFKLAGRGLPHMEETECDDRGRTAGPRASVTIFSGHVSAIRARPRWSTRRRRGAAFWMREIGADDA